MSEAEAQVMAPEPETNELPPPHIQDMIQHAMDNEFTKANNIFDDLMTVKLNDVLDQEQIRMADQIYNGVEDEEADTDKDQLELDLETESELESEDEANEESDEVEEEDEMTDEEINDVIDNLSDEELAELEAEIESEEDKNSSE
jgi:hypothetical protein